MPVPSVAPVAIAPAAPLPDAADARTPLTFASYNIHGCGCSTTFDAQRVAAAIAETDADVVALQEAGVLQDEMDQVQAIASLLGMHPVFGPNMTGMGGRYRYGNAILSRFPITSSANYDLSVAGAEPRGCLVARLAIPGGGTLAAASVHLGLSHGERVEQTRRLAGSAILGGIAAEGAPLVVGGDMNDWFPGRDTRTMRGAMRDAWKTGGRVGGARATYPAILPLLRLDHVYVSGGVDVRSCAPSRTSLTRSASDHLPVVAKLSVAYYDPCSSRSASSSS